MNLFQLGTFTLASGRQSRLKIECDALRLADWDALAYMAAEVLPPFSSVVSPLKGGILFAEALRKYATAQGPMVICHDTYVPGGSIGEISRDRESTIGIVVFARGPCPEWITPLLQLPKALWTI